MRATIAAQIEALRSMTVADLREKYEEVFGEECRSRHKDFLRKRIAWRIQANEYGGLSEKALRRAEELANEADLRMLAPRSAESLSITRIKPNLEHRVPLPGTVITREYRGRTITVTILKEGFEYDGNVYRSLTAVAKAITGSHWNGRLFFGMSGKLKP